MGILDFLYPKRCVGCKKTGDYLCASCLSLAKLHFPQVCPVCERNSIDGLTHVRCKKGFVPNGLISLWDYQGVPKKAIVTMQITALGHINPSVIDLELFKPFSWRQ